MRGAKSTSDDVDRSGEVSRGDKYSTVYSESLTHTPIAHDGYLSVDCRHSEVNHSEAMFTITSILKVSLGFTHATVHSATITRSSLMIRTDLANKFHDFQKNSCSPYSVPHATDNCGRSAQSPMPLHHNTDLSPQNRT